MHASGIRSRTQVKAPKKNHTNFTQNPRVSREIATTWRSLHVDPVGAMGESAPDGASFPRAIRARGTPRRRRDWAGSEGERQRKVVKGGTARTSISRRGRRIWRRAGPSGPSTRGGRRSWGRGPCSRSSSRSGPGTAAAAGPDSGAAPASASAGRKQAPPAAAAAVAAAAVWAG